MDIAFLYFSLIKGEVTLDILVEYYCQAQSLRLFSWNNTGYDRQVDLKSFGIDEEAEVIEIPSDFLHDEKLIKSAFGKKKKTFKCSNCDKTFRNSM